MMRRYIEQEGKHFYIRKDIMSFFDRKKGLYEDKN